MDKLKKLLSLCTTKDDEVPSVEYIAEKMTPVNEESLRLPRSFAHTMRNILDMEEEACDSNSKTRDKE